MNKKRIEKISSLFEKSNTMLDIGTDHALIPLYLVEHNLVKKVYFTEINSLPFENALMNIKKKNKEIFFEGKIGDGTLPYSYLRDIDYLSITGMGTKTITEILNKTSNLEDFKYIVLESTNDIKGIFYWQYKNKYEIIWQRIIHEGNKYNFALKLKKSKKVKKTNFRYYIGNYNTINLDDRFLLKNYLIDKINHVEKILHQKNSNYKKTNKNFYLNIFLLKEKFLKNNLKKDLYTYKLILNKYF